MAGETKTRRSNQERKARLAQKNYWDDLMTIRDAQREQIRTGIQVVREGDLPLESNRQGLMRWYMHPSIKDTCLSTMIFFQQEIPPGSRSGRIKFQGGQVILVLEGKGDDPGEHEGRPEGRVDEELDGGVDPPVAPPNPDHEVHRDQDRLEEDEEHEEVEGQEHTDQTGLEQQSHHHEQPPLLGDGG